MVLGVCLTTLAALVWVALAATPRRGSGDSGPCRGGPGRWAGGPEVTSPRSAGPRPPDPRLPLDDVVDLDAVPVVDRLTFAAERDGVSTQSVEPHELRRFRDLPPIAGPGLFPMPRTGGEGAI